MAFVLLVVSIASIYSAYKIFMSASYQTFLMWDFNNETHDTPYEIYAENLMLTILTNIHLSSNEVYARVRYYIHEDSIQKLKLLFEARKSNPFIKALNYCYRTFITMKKISVHLFCERRILQSTNVNAHRSVFFRVLTHLMIQQNLIRLLK